LLTIDPWVFTKVDTTNLHLHESEKNNYCNSKFIIFLFETVGKKSAGKPKKN
jgi:hypothetical protein